jgi:predicted site-specific integrase-resolvase
MADQDVKRVVVEYQDRIARFGFETWVGYGHNLGVEVVVLQEAEPKEFEQELAEDIVALVASYSARR